MTRMVRRYEDDGHGDVRLTTIDPSRDPEWGIVLTSEQVESPDFGISLARTSPCSRPTFDPNTGYWYSNFVQTFDAEDCPVVRYGPWHPPYRWHREPIKRLRVEWARWKARR